MLSTAMKQNLSTLHTLENLYFNNKLSSENGRSIPHDVSLFRNLPNIFGITEGTLDVGYDKECTHHDTIPWRKEKKIKK